MQKLSMFVLTPAILLLIHSASFGQSSATTYKCDCQKIGFDPVWSDTNRVSCYLIPVERNLGKPRGKSYLLAVATVPAIDGKPKDPILYLHGGPGIATLGNLPRYIKSKTFSVLREDHDLIFFDYRGTGYSEPAMCSDLGDSIREISNNAASLQAEVTGTVKAYSDCKGNLLRQDILLSDFSSLQSAADAESIRKALSVTNWNIYSVSHGTTVALNMMRSFPRHIKSVILDSPFPPNAPWSDFIHPFDLGFKTLEKNISGDTQYARFFPSVREDFIKITRRLKFHPLSIPLQSPDSSPKKFYAFDDNDFAWSLWTAMLDRLSLPLIPLALKEIAAGNDSVLMRWATFYNDPNSFGQFGVAQSKAKLVSIEVTNDLATKTSLGKYLNRCRQNWIRIT